ncbi:NAD-dependent epimerase/dehydratase family protein [Persicobacter diffluens]|uniref:NAD-dependent epimerase n=1 Tax=Persicobacter diffluens TaxID=981 RepID=A0AAN4VY16_9BACT|nr:NAD-dependent epimerase [Persicobacter diffluens]
MVFVTGATGFIGSYICRSLLLHGHQLRCLKRAQSNMKLLEDVAHLIEWVEGDLMDLLWLEQQLEGVDKIVHAAAMVSFGDEDPSEMYHTNIQGTHQLVNLALEKQIKQFVHISSIAAIGNAPEGEITDESHHWEEKSDGSSAYALSKQRAEMEVWRGVYEGLNAVIVNPSVVLGPCPANQSSGKLLAYLKEGNRFYTEGTISLVDVRDVAEVVRLLMEKEILGERFILSAASKGYQEFFKEVRQRWGLTMSLKKIGKKRLTSLRAIEKLIGLISGRQAKISKDMIRQVGESNYYSSDKVMDFLDFQFRPLAETLDWTCQSFDT